MKVKLITTMLLTLSFLTITGCNNSLEADPPITESKGSRDLNLFVATDLHYLSPDLHDNGQAFQEYIKNGDSKLLNYSDPLADSFVNDVIHEKPDVVILSGDLTNNGEKKSHSELANKLKQIEQSGTSVYVIPGNHDILNPWARSFKTDGQYVTDYITPKEFTTIYNNFGYDEALSRDTDSLSYVAEISDDLWLLMLDTSKYDNNVILKIPQTDGEVSKETLDWIQENTRLAEEKRVNIITVMHHNLIDHSDVSSNGFTLNNHEEVLNVLKKSNISLVLSGHIHIQDIQSEKNVYDIATSAFGVYPHQYGTLHYSPNPSSIEYRTQMVDVEKWSEQEGIKNEDLLHFSSYARDFFYEDSYRKAYQSLDGQGYTEEERTEMATSMAKLNLLYFSGNSKEIGPTITNSKGIELWNKAKDQFLKSYVESMLNSSKENNHLTLSLNPTE
ncbi:metallophosphoesterase [Paenibacillus segetis]|uniref:Serine/threonine protein phosphatase n=1 Tax=Paenibacillus segetis TaxID=1325360 RepID=A0ABQ1YCW4_9BACL|nr:metallophosphoesterase [Paenibacillus segetis]GGH19846.1 serine/threonine protein phosphatase [Paenibacillus segetis]